MRARLKSHWFLISLGLIFAIGFFASEALTPLLEMTTLRSAIVFAVMGSMGITLPAQSVRQSLRKPLPTLLAIAINIVVVPMMCWPMRAYLPAPIFGGLFVASLVPCTLASAAVWTRKAGGNESIALMTTVVTNLACIAVVPIGVALVLAKTTELSLTDQVWNLTWVVVIPIVLSQTMRMAGLAEWADRQKLRLSFLAQLGILSMVGFGSIASAMVVREAMQENASLFGIQIGQLFVSVAMLHVAALVFGVFAARVVRADRESQIAVGIAGSQKTLTIGLQIAIDCGVSVIPMLMYHFTQLVIDTMIASRWSNASKSKTKSNEKTSGRIRKGG